MPNFVSSRAAGAHLLIGEACLASATELSMEIGSNEISINILRFEVQLQSYSSDKVHDPTLVSRAR